MRILVLDDDDARHDRFRQWLIGAVVDHVHSAAEARGMLRAKRYDLVCLDHDLDLLSTMGQEPDEETGYDVAQFIGLHMEREQYPAQVLIHSVNPSGAARMYAALAGAGIRVVKVPFSLSLGMVLAKWLASTKTE